MSQVYKNRTIEDALCYLKTVHGIRSLKDLQNNPIVLDRIKINAEQKFVLDCLLIDAIRKG